MADDEVTCARCGQALPDEDPDQRRPCPSCGSTTRTFHRSVTGSIRLSGSAEARVERGVTEARVSAFGLILAIAIGTGLTVGFEANAAWGAVSALVVALVAAGILAAVHRLRGVRRVVMELMHRITGQ